MDTKKIVDYVKETPYNTNPALLYQMLKELQIGDNPDLIELNVTENNIYEASDGKAFYKVNVNVPIPEQQEDVVDTFEIVENLELRNSGTPSYAKVYYELSKELLENQELLIANDGNKLYEKQPDGRYTHMNLNGDIDFLIQKEGTKYYGFTININPVITLNDNPNNQFLKVGDITLSFTFTDFIPNYCNFNNNGVIFDAAEKKFYMTSYEESDNTLTVTTKVYGTNQGGLFVKQSETSTTYTKNE